LPAKRIALAGNPLRDIISLGELFMSTNESELFHFSEFVAGKLQSGSSDLTPEQCLELWRLEYPAGYRERVDSIQAAIVEMESGSGSVDGRELHA
jgi:hypothetical protein